jgi:hypothetical protein
MFRVDTLSFIGYSMSRGRRDTLIMNIPNFEIGTAFERAEFQIS